MSNTKMTPHPKDNLLNLRHEIRIGNRARLVVGISRLNKPITKQTYSYLWTPFYSVVKQMKYCYRNWVSHRN